MSLISKILLLCLSLFIHTNKINCAAAISQFCDESIYQAGNPKHERIEDIHHDDPMQANLVFPHLYYLLQDPELQKITDTQNAIARLEPEISQLRYNLGLNKEYFIATPAQFLAGPNTTYQSICYPSSLKYKK